MPKAKKQPNTFATPAASDPAPSSALDQLLDQIKAAPMTVLDIARMSPEKRAEWLKNNPPGPPTWRTSPFETALHELASQAAEPHAYYSAMGAGRRLLLVRHAVQELGDDDLQNEMADHEDPAFEACTEARSASAGDVAAKIAGIILHSGGLQDIEPIRQALGVCLAELVLLGDKPLPGIAPLLGMTGADAEQRDMPVQERAA